MRAYFSGTLFFFLQVGCTEFPYDLGYYALVIGPWMENRGEHEWTSVTRRITYFDVERRN